MGVISEMCIVGPEWLVEVIFEQWKKEGKFEKDSEEEEKE